VGSFYKVLAKLLAKRLRGVIGTVISDTQSAFVKGRQILDGILVANEVVDEAKKLNKNLLMFKVDFEKAYDFVDWNYLDDVMCKMSFPSLWRKWMKECVTTATTTVLVNGWDPVINHIKSRLLSWKSKYLSFGGRLFYRILVYALSFFIALSGIISSIKSLFIHFFFGVRVI
jgi:hypothetical protein